MRSKRLPFEDYVAEIATQPPSEWTADQWHVVSEFYLNHVDPVLSGNSTGDRST